MSRYNTIQTVKPKETKRLLTTSYPKIPYTSDDFYVITTGGDRFDILANEYYGNTEYWWVIAVANPHVSRKNFVINQGVQLRIPVNIEDIVAKFQEKNAQNQL
jgi:phage tail protein X